ncbi:MAG: nuclear transport factor 2 family protein [Gemmatimonadaceae bacterium]
MGILVEHVEGGNFIDAIDCLYADDAESFDTGGICTSGKPALLDKERNFLATIAQWHAHQALDVIVDDMLVAIHWHFELTRRTGERITLEEIALQRWRGTGVDARIVQEKYFPFAPWGLKS